jgi:hypothetical protein
VSWLAIVFSGRFRSALYACGVELSGVGTPVFIY